MIIDTDNLSSLTLHELAALLLLYDSRVDKSRTVVQVKDTDIKDLMHSLYKKGFISTVIYSTDNSYVPPYKHLAFSLLEKGKIAIADNCVTAKPSTKKAVTKAVKDRCDALAVKLMELYPGGKKPGTANQWRGYKGGVSEKLQKLIQLGNEFTDDEAIAATKAYVSGFNGMYTSMRTLPYFLGKNEIVGGEVKKTCDFMTYVEDFRNNPQQSSIDTNWDIRLC